jgi:membrane-associated phospholipid phosphatase
MPHSSGGAAPAEAAAAGPAEVRGEPAGERPQEGLSRRGLLGGGIGLAGWVVAGEALAAAGASAAAAASSGAAPGRGSPAGPAPAAGSWQGRERRVLETRLAAARLQDSLPRPRHATNGDEAELPGWIACYSKGLPHDALGRVDDAAYRLLRRALASGHPADFEAIPLGGFVKLANPQAALALNLIGPDPARLDLAPPPRFASSEQAAELLELYWQALLRDVAFADYDSHPLARRAAEDLSRIPGFQGPRDDRGRVAPASLFRGTGSGCLTGPYLSQFLYRDIFLPPMWVPQKVRTAAPGLDYMMAHDPWLACQNGAIAGVNRFDEHPRHIRNGRDLGEFVHRDFSYQAALDAALVLVKMGAPANGGNPYMHSRTQTGFATFGAPYLFYLLAIVTQAALTASWYQKWYVHRRLRPEEYAGRVEMHRTGRAREPVAGEVLASEAMAEVTRRHASALLPQAYPEGCPTHPSYPAAHAVIAGAGTTVLKAFFDESYLVTNPVVPAPDGLALLPYAGPPLAIGAELDKLAWNVGMGRNFAGIHWRSDVAAGLEMGEAVALAVLREMKLTGNELFSGFSLRRLDGQRVTI